MIINETKDQNKNNDNAYQATKTLLISGIVIIVFLIGIYASFQTIINNHLHPHGLFGRRWVPWSETPGPMGPEYSEGYYEYPHKGRWMSSWQHHLNIFLYIMIIVQLIAIAIASIFIWELWDKSLKKSA